MKNPMSGLIRLPASAAPAATLQLVDLLNERQRAAFADLDAPVTLEVATRPAPPRDEFKVVAFNVFQGRKILKILGALQNHPDLADAEVLALQEVDRHNERTGGVDLSGLLAREVAMSGAYGVEFIEINHGRRSSGGGDHGNLTLSRFPLTQPHIISLPLGFDWRKSKAMPRLGRRMAIVSEVSIGGARVRVINAHLENQCLARQRFKQIETIFEWEKQLGDPIPSVLLGDMNTFLFREPSKFRQIAAEYGYTDALPRRPNGTWGRFFRLDWILTRDLEVVSSGISRDVNGSDHKPVWAVIKTPVPRP